MLQYVVIAEHVAPTAALMTASSVSAQTAVAELGASVGAGVGLSVAQ